jgi:hypothetical protein
LQQNPSRIDGDTEERRGEKFSSDSLFLGLQSETYCASTTALLDVKLGDSVVHEQHNKPTRFGANNLQNG